MREARRNLSHYAKLYCQLMSELHPSLILIAVFFSLNHRTHNAALDFLIVCENPKRRRRRRTPKSIPWWSREHALIDLRRISEHDEAKVAHVLLRDALHLSRGDSVQLVQKLQRVAPAAAE